MMANQRLMMVDGAYCWSLHASFHGLLVHDFAQAARAAAALSSEEFAAARVDRQQRQKAREEPGRTRLLDTL